MGAGQLSFELEKFVADVFESARSDGVIENYHPVRGYGANNGKVVAFWARSHNGEEKCFRFQTDSESAPGRLRRNYLLVVVHGLSDGCRKAVEKIIDDEFGIDQVG